MLGLLTQLLALTHCIGSNPDQSRRTNGQGSQDRQGKGIEVKWRDCTPGAKGKGHRGRGPENRDEQGSQIYGPGRRQAGGRDT